MAERPPVDREKVIAGLRALGPRSLRLTPGQEATVRWAIEEKRRKLRVRRRRVRMLRWGVFLAGVVVGAVLVHLLT